MLRADAERVNPSEAGIPWAIRMPDPTASRALQLAQPQLPELGPPPSIMISPSTYPPAPHPPSQRSLPQPQGRRRTQRQRKTASVERSCQRPRLPAGKTTSGKRTCLDRATDPLIGTTGILTVRWCAPPLTQVDFATTATAGQVPFDLAQTVQRSSHHVAANQLFHRSCCRPAEAQQPIDIIEMAKQVTMK